jgi:hypothetical protein
MALRPCVILQPDVQLYELIGPGRAKIIGMDAVLDVRELPFEIDAAGPQLPVGKVGFVLLTTGEYWLVAGDRERGSMRYFLATPMGS